MDAHAPLPGSRIRPGSGSSGLCLRNFTFTVNVAFLRPRGSPHHLDRERPDGGHRTIARGARWGWRRIEMSAASGGI